MSEFTEKVRAMLDFLTTKDWSWSGRTEEPDKDMPGGVFIWHPQGSYLGDTMICLADTYEDDHKDLDFIAAAPTLLREACERIEKLEKVADAARDIVTYGSVEPDKGMDGETIVATWRFAVMQNAISALDAKEQDVTATTDENATSGGRG